MSNKKVYHEYGKVWLEYEYWFFSFKRKGKKLLADLDWVGSGDLFAEYPKGLREQLDNLVRYYGSLYCE